MYLVQYTYMRFRISEQEGVFSFQEEGKKGYLFYMKGWIYVSEPWALIYIYNLRQKEN